MAEYDRPEARRDGMDNMPHIPGYGYATHIRGRKVDVGPEESYDVTAEVDSREDSIGNQLNRLGHMLDANLKMVSILEERLQPILSDLLPSEEKSFAERGYTTRFSEMVGAAQERSLQFQRQLESIIKRIEL